MSQTVSSQSRRSDQETRARQTVDTDEFLALLGDEYTRAIIEAVAERPRSGSEIVERTGFSKATVYRRLDRLKTAGLVESQTMFDPDGHHCEQFEVTFDGATCQFGPDGLETTVHHTAAGD